MGKIALTAKGRQHRRIRKEPLNEAQRELLEQARYEGSPYHKRNPGDFGLTPPAARTADKTLCDDSGVTSLKEASRIFARAVQREVVSEALTQNHPSRLWVVDDDQVFECKYGGSTDGRYHGYPLEDDDPQAEVVRRAWGRK
jgi:hypothetical protein